MFQILRFRFHALRSTLHVSRFKLQDRGGQVMLLTVLVISGTLMSISLIAGLLMLYQIRQAGDLTNSAKAVFAADSGLEWWLFDSRGFNINPRIETSSVTFSNGQNFEIIDLGGGRAKIIGTAGNSRRAFQVEPQNASVTSLIPCDLKLDMMILVDQSSSMSNLAIIETRLKEFFDLMGIGINQAHVGQISFSTAPRLWHITSDITTAKNNVDAITLVAPNRTDLGAAITFAIGEFNNAQDYNGDGTFDDADLNGVVPDHPPNHASPNPPAGEYPDYIVIITDDRPNRPQGPPPGNALTQATNAATAAKTAGVEIFVAYEGTDNADIAFLRDNIASSPNHFFSTASFDVDNPLDNMLVCGQNP